LLTGGDEWLLAENVRGFEVFCVDEDDDVTEAWDSRETQSLPRSVLLRLWLWNPEKPEEDPVPYALRVSLPLYEEAT